MTNTLTDFDSAGRIRNELQLAGAYNHKKWALGRVALLLALTFPETEK